MTSMWHLCIFITFITIGTSSALKCHVCDSERTPDCEKKPKKTDIQECSYTLNIQPSTEDRRWWDDIVSVDYQYLEKVEPPAVCQKLILDNKEAGNKKVVIRKCQVATNDPNACNIAANKNSMKMLTNTDFLCEICDTDGCNNGETIRVWWPMKILLFSIAIAHYLRE